MEYKQNNTPEDENLQSGNTQPNAWLDEILGKAPENIEIGPDEQAVTFAGLTHPDDLELEEILSLCRTLYEGGAK